MTIQGAILHSPFSHFVGITIRRFDFFALLPSCSPGGAGACGDYRNFGSLQRQL